MFKYNKLDTKVIARRTLLAGESYEIAQPFVLKSPIVQNVTPAKSLVFRPSQRRFAQRKRAREISRANVIFAQRIDTADQLEDHFEIDISKPLTRAEVLQKIRAFTSTSKRSK